MQHNLSQNYFLLFGLKVEYEILSDELELAFSDLQKKLHPDNFPNSDESTKQSLVVQTSIINDAYSILKDDLLRAEYLLKLHDIIVNRDGAGVKPSQEILLESMESREELFNIKQMDVLNIFKSRLDNNLLKCKENLAVSFNIFNHNDAAQLTIKLRYLQKLRQEVEEKKSKLV